MARNAPFADHAYAPPPHHIPNGRQLGAILLESLVALAILSLGAAAMFRAFDYLEATSRAASQFRADVRTPSDQTETR